MKKVLAVLSIVALASCGGAETKETVVDSVVVDSVVVDSVVAPVDTVVTGGGKQDGTEIK
jgi:hypothetical protein